MRKSILGRWKTLGLLAIVALTAGCSNPTGSGNSGASGGSGSGGSTGATGWQLVGTAGFSADSVGHISLRVDSSGSPVLAYADGASARTTVRKWNGSSWSLMGTRKEINGLPLALALSPAGTPWILVRDFANSWGASVYAWDGSSWTLKGSANFSGGQVNISGALEFSSAGTAYAAYVFNGSPMSVHVKRFDGASWVDAGSNRASGGASKFPALAADASGNIYLAYKDNAGNGGVTVKELAGGSWQTVGTADFTTLIDVDGPLDITVNAGVPYVAYNDSSGLTVRRFNGAAWELVGQTEFTGTDADMVSICFDSSGTPYVSFEDSSYSQKAMMDVWSGSSWNSVGGGFSAGDASDLDMAIGNADAAYAAFSDNTQSWHLTVMKHP